MTALPESLKTGLAELKQSDSALRLKILEAIECYEAEQETRECRDLGYLVHTEWPKTEPFYDICFPYFKVSRSYAWSIRIFPTKYAAEFSGEFDFDPFPCRMELTRDCGGERAGNLYRIKSHPAPTEYGEKKLFGSIFLLCPLCGDVSDIHEPRVLLPEISNATFPFSPRESKRMWDTYFGYFHAFKITKKELNWFNGVRHDLPASAWKWGNRKCTKCDRDNTDQAWNRAKEAEAAHAKYLAEMEIEWERKQKLESIRKQIALQGIRDRKVTPQEIQVFQMMAVGAAIASTQQESTNDKRN